MSEHRARLAWRRTSPSFEYKAYNRDHSATFKNGQTVRLSAAVAFRGDADAIDPEEAFVASVASCHMLTFLAIASRGGLVVNQYQDDAVGVLAKNDRGQLAVTRVTLHPKIDFEGGSPDAATLNRMHEQSHHECFIANSITTEVVVKTE